MGHERFNKPPIVEALAAFRFNSEKSWSDELRLRIANRLVGMYPTQEIRDVHSVFVPFGSPKQVTAPVTNRRVTLRTADKTGLVSLEREALTVHVLPPYPGWAVFQARITDAVEAVQAEAGSVGILEVAIRYIDRIALPAGVPHNLEDYFTAIPRRPVEMPGQLGALQFITQAYDPETGVTGLLTTSALPPAPGEGFVMLYDLNLVKGYPPASPLAADGFIETLNELHDRQYKIFMASITDKTRGLFS